MDINNINAEVATESPPVEAPLPQAKPSAIDSAAKAEKIKNLKLKEEQNTENKALSAEKIEQITIDLNEYMSDLQTNLRFSMYEKLDNQVVVEIKNRKTDELIKQIPSEELLELRVKMEELTGLLFDETI
jgi:flagellar protein FlaG